MIRINKKLRLGIIGAGGIAGAYSAAIDQMNDVELAVVADTNTAAADELAGKHGADSLHNADSLVGRDDLDAVIVCTPPLYHPEHCTMLLRRGINVLCEKPLAIDHESAVAMVQAANEGGAMFTMASKFRFVDDFEVARRMLDEGQLGNIVLYENCFTGVVDMSGRWNSDPAVSGGGVLIDNGTHSLDIMRFFLGDLDEIRVVEGIRIQPLQVEDTVHIFVRSKTGAIGSIDLSWSLHKEMPYFVSLYGTEGTVQIGWQSSRYKLKDDEQWTTFGSGYNKVESFRRQLQNFMAAIVSGEPLRISPEDSVASVFAVEAAYQAMADRGWHPVDCHRQHLTKP